MVGIICTKISRKNNKKSHVRKFFYNPHLDAICWMDIKQKFPKED
jgi:hypothetical protein